MHFANDSNITLVLTSCGRLDLLQKTLESFDRYNTAPIREVLITEDSGNEGVHQAIPHSWRPFTRVFINRPQLGQIASIDMAYAEVRTSLIFHCEDDWEFYRPGFIEDSLAILEAVPTVLQVWLRSYAHDIRIHSPYHHLGPRRMIAGVACYPLLSDKPDWQGFSFNPGLRRLADYQRLAPYAEKGGEKRLSIDYAELGLTAMVLEGDAVLHTGFEAHVVVPKERSRKKSRRRIDRWKMVLCAVLGLACGFALGALPW
ncbi:glycosyltransferase family 2 protein [Pseudomonas sp.]|uniref:glycosyltransferase family 2 protein n=1 Tax=Pseudomonas sp. TaxID=306 RepID=UPI00272F8D68|nr:glycosyltransferase family 2 protein [Pseudomonas sp.]MDP2242729.1 glycosyltransferase family 2 protein [Pseudomonas sp.]